MRMHFLSSGATVCFLCYFWCRSQRFLLFGVYNVPFIVHAATLIFPSIIGILESFTSSSELSINLETRHEALRSVSNILVYYSTNRKDLHEEAGQSTLLALCDLTSVLLVLIKPDDNIWKIVFNYVVLQVRSWIRSENGLNFDSLTNHPSNDI